MTHINQRRDTAANWVSANPVLQLGEVGWETDTRKSKLGDGAAAWNSLPYATAGPQDLSAYAPIASPEFTGNPKAPTPTTSDNDTSIATTQYVKAQFIDAALTGNPTAPTPATGDSDTSVATTAYVKAQLVDTPLTGNPTAPTPTAGDNDTSVATTAFVQGAVSGGTARIVGPFPTTAPPNGTTGTAIAVTKPGTYLFSVSASGYTATGSPVARTWTHYLDGVSGVSDVQYFNANNSHLTSITYSFTAVLTAGTHYLYTRFSGDSDSAGDRAIWTYQRIGV